MHDILKQSEAAEILKFQFDLVCHVCMGDLRLRGKKSCSKIFLLPWKLTGVIIPFLVGQ